MVLFRKCPYEGIIHGINLARVMTLLSSYNSANGPFLTMHKGGEGKGGVQDSAIMYFGSAKQSQKI